MTTTTKELIDKIMLNFSSDTAYTKLAIHGILEKHLQELPQQEVYRIYIQGVPRCSCCNSSLIAAEIFCTGCGAKIKRID